MTRVSKNISALRMQQLMEERGLVSPTAQTVVPKGQQRAVQLARVQYERAEEAKRPPASMPERPCPCKAAGLLTGRHILPGQGQCVDGEFFSLVDKQKINWVHQRAKDPANATVFVDALRTLRKHADLDIEAVMIHRTEPCSSTPDSFLPSPTVG